MKSVIIVGMVGPFEGERNGSQIWGLNRTYEHQPNVDRQYFFDDFEYFKSNCPDFVKRINELGCPVYTKQHIPEIPLSKSYPLNEIIGRYGIKYFTSTVAYMIAHAIYEGFERIVLHKILHLGPHDGDYWEQKANLDFWCGYAMGLGVEVSPSEDSHVMKPWPWQPADYGYTPGNPMIKDIIRVGFRRVG